MSNILFITGAQGTGKTLLADYIEMIVQNGRQELLLLDPFEPDVDDLGEILSYDLKNRLVVLVTNLDDQALYDLCPSSRERIQLDYIVAQSTRIHLARP